MGKRLARQLTIGGAALVVLVVSPMLVGYAQWVHEIADGSGALAAEDYPAAEQAFAAAAIRAEHSLLPLTAFRSPWRRLVFNRARGLYAMNQYDALRRMLEAEAQRVPALADDPEYHFWMGNVQYRAALTQMDKAALRAGIERASESFRLGLALAPDDWDLKYNYELTARLLEGMRNKDDRTEKLKRGEMKILREDSEKAKEPQQKLAPEKRS